MAPKGGAPKGVGPPRVWGPQGCGAPKGVGPPRVGGPEGWAPKGGAPKGGAPKGGAPKSSLFFFPFPPPFRSFCLSLGVFSLNFGGVSTPPKFNEKTPRERQKERNGGREGKKKSEILGGPAEGGPAEGGPGKSKPATTTTTTPNPEQVGPRRAGPLSQARFRVWVGHNNTQQQKLAKTLKLAKVGLAKVGHDR